MDTGDGKQISAKTVVVQEVIISANSTGHSRINEGTIGSGKAFVFRDGQAIEGTWKKDSRESRTRFFNNTGKEIAFNRGSIWMEVVPTNSLVSYK